MTRGPGLEVDEDVDGNPLGQFRPGVDQGAEDIDLAHLPGQAVQEQAFPLAHRADVEEGLDLVQVAGQGLAQGP